ncbi:MAG: hypothetical protein Q7Q71_14405 [Verrucomicrobiota bacterium JB023]|nr:hypothetical protein [Verrucomicrobiota bacterium JB023]
MGAANIDFDIAAGDDATNAVVRHLADQLRYKNSGLGTSSLGGSLAANGGSRGLSDLGAAFETPVNFGTETASRSYGFVRGFPASGWAPYDDFSEWREEVRRFPKAPTLRFPRSGLVEISANGEPGFPYEILLRDGLAEGGWEPIADFVAGDEPQTLELEIRSFGARSFLVLREKVN